MHDRPPGRQSSSTSRSSTGGGGTPRWAASRARVVAFQAARIEHVGGAAEVDGDLQLVGAGGLGGRSLDARVAGRQGGAKVDDVRGSSPRYWIQSHTIRRCRRRSTESSHSASNTGPVPPTASMALAPRRREVEAEVDEHPVAPSTPASRSAPARAGRGHTGEARASQPGNGRAAQLHDLRPQELEAAIHRDIDGRAVGLGSRASDLIERAPAMGTAIPCPHPATSSSSWAAPDPSSTASSPAGILGVRPRIVQRHAIQVGLSHGSALRTSGRTSSAFGHRFARRCPGASGRVGAPPATRPRPRRAASRPAGDHRPQLLGDPPVVGGGPQLTEDRVQPEVDPLDDDEPAGTVAYWAMGELRSNTRRTVADAYSGVQVTCVSSRTAS